MRLLRWSGVFAVLLVVAHPKASAAQTNYQLAKTVPLPGGPKWDYLHFDAPSDRLYISRGNEVSVFNVISGKLIGSLPGLPGSHGIAVDPQSGLVYADSALNSEVIAFDPKTLQPVAKIPVLADADGMAYDPASKQIFVAGGDANGVTPIDPATNKAAPMISLGGAPEFLAADGAGSLYVNINDKNQIVKIDTASDKIIARWDAAPCESPTGMAVDATDRQIFSSCHSGVMLILDADTGKIIATPAIGKGTDAAVFDPVTKQAFSSNGDGTMNVISQTTPGVFSDVMTHTQAGARTMAIDPKTGDVFLVTAKVTATMPATEPNGHPHYTFAPNSVALLILAPAT